MSSDREIGAPFTIASLPHPLDSTNGRTQASSVWSISGAKKRKRTEVAVGVDGEGILVYSLQNPQLVTSYALPPQTSFTTPPCSLYRKGNSSRPTRRFTYASVFDSSSRNKSEIVCFLEETRKDTPADTAKSSYQFDNQHGTLVLIDAIPLGNSNLTTDASHDVLVVFQDGHTACLSADLQDVRWEALLETTSKKKSQSGSGTKVEYAALSSANNVVRGFLRNREDIASLLGPTSNVDSNLLDLTQILCMAAIHSNSTISLSLHHIQPRSTDLVSSRLTPLKRLVGWVLPSSTVATTAASATRSYSLHTSSGVLHLLVDGGLVSYDFTGLLPRVTSEVKPTGARIESFLRISPDLLFATSAHAGSLFDVKYNSIQAHTVLTPSLNEQSPSRKRKHAELGVGTVADTSPTLIAFFSETGLAVAVRNNEVVGFQLWSTLARKKQRAHGALLIDSIGRGIPQKQRTSNKSSTDADWQVKVRRLDEYASKGNIAEFEEEFARFLGIKLAASEKGREEQATRAEGTRNSEKGPLLTNGVHEKLPAINGSPDEEESSATPDAPLRKWELPKSLADEARHLHRRKAMYALSKIFSWHEAESVSKDSQQPALKVDFFPPNVLEWLLRAGYLTKESIRHSVQFNFAHNMTTLPTLTDGDIVKALVHFDTDLHILSAVLNNSQFLPIGEVVQAIKSLMESLDDHAKSEDGPKLLTNGVESSEDEMDIDFVSELEAASHDIDRALSMLDHGILTRSHTLRPALIRLHTFSARVVTSTLRSMLPRHDLESLIRVLLFELRNGGWTTPYDSAESENPAAEPSAEAPDDHAVSIIASLLSCTLDAIGTGAWLASVGASASEDTPEDIMNELHEETTLALNGFWEARFMRGLLSEFLRYAANLQKTQKPTNRSLQNQGKPFGLEMIPDDELPMLPLGGKVDLGIEKTKPGKGGKREERSAREIGMLISKRVPKYSFERIVI
ncbi:hypothetical protein BDV96DRAFT_623572 [Lophiotrema nucula]|uniref:Utp8 beta-propeller domain-containing protein n=1 Tax=Lophiotrema nucula TaxID=690887 RepID=A0A6A5YWG8_9PLEO|nr:hypothetical protein BDV96DRAFT_623572 [Lophiotrema nucula]